MDFMVNIEKITNVNFKNKLTLINRMNLQGNIRNAYSASDHAGLLHSTRVISFGYVNPLMDQM